MLKYIILFFLLMNLTSLLAVDKFTSLKEWFPQQDKFRIITQDEIDALENATVSELIQKFGEPIRLEINALAWPKYRDDMDFNQSKVDTKVRYAYWFFFDGDRDPKPTDRLMFVFSLKGAIKERQNPILHEIPQMTVDWPVRLKGIIASEFFYEH